MLLHAQDLLAAFCIMKYTMANDIVLVLRHCLRNVSLLTGDAIKKKKNDVI